MSPVFKGTEDTPNDHLIYLQVDIEDDLDPTIFEAVVGDCEMMSWANEQPVDIKVRCYRKKLQKNLLRYLENLGLETEV